MAKTTVKEVRSGLKKVNMKLTTGYFLTRKGKPSKKYACSGGALTALYFLYHTEKHNTELIINCGDTCEFCGAKLSELFHMEDIVDKWADKKYGEDFTTGFDDAFIEHFNDLIHGLKSWNFHDSGSEKQYVLGFKEGKRIRKYLLNEN